MKSKHFIYFMLLAFFLFATFAANAGVITKQEAESFAQKQGDALLEAFSEEDLELKYQKLDEMLINYVDLSYIGKFVIGKYWREMNDAQRQNYQDLFKRYVISTYKGFPLKFENKVDFNIVSSRPDGDDMFVTTDIVYNRNTPPDIFRVEFRMHKPQNKIMFTDIKIGESSLLLSYRQKFYEMIKSAEEDMDWFIEDFELSVTSAEKHYALPED